MSLKMNAPQEWPQRGVTTHSAYLRQPDRHFLRNLVGKTADTLQEIIGQEREAFEGRYGAYPALQRIEKVVTTQCRRYAKQ